MKTVDLQPVRAHVSLYPAQILELQFAPIRSNSLAHGEFEATLVFQMDRCVMRMVAKL